MIFIKMKKAFFFLSLLFLIQCYTDPFFELTVEVLDQNLNPVSNATVKIEVVDIENGELIDGSLIHFESVTSSDGKALFSFDNKAFVTARACLLSPSVPAGSDVYLCKEGHVYLEENINKKLTLMLQSENCSFCL